MTENTPQNQPEISTDQERRRLFLKYVNRGWLIFGLVTLTSIPFFPEERGVFIYLMAVIFPSYLITRYLNLAGKTRQAGLVFTLAVNFGFYGLFLVLVAERGAEEAFRTQATVWMLMGLAVLFAGAFIDKWAAPAVALFDTVLLIGTQFVLAPESEKRPSPVVFWWMMALTIWLYERTLHQALQRAWDELAARKRANEELRKLSSAVEHSPASITITDPDGTIEYVNPRFTVNTGYEPQEVLGRNLSFLKSGLTPLDEYAVLWDTVKAGEEWRGEFCNRKKSGELYWELASVSPITNEDGQISHVVAVNEDITERKQAEEALRESESRFRRLFEHSPVAYQALNEAGCFLDVNVPLCELLGFRAEELIGRSFGDMWSPETRPFFPDQFARFKADGRWRADVQLVRKDGTPIAVILEGNIERDIQGKFSRTHCILFDITDRQRIEAAQRQSERQLKRAQQIAHMGHWSWAFPTRQLELSDEMYTIFGLERDALKRDVVEIIRRTTYAEDLARVVSLFEQAVQAQDPAGIEYRIVRPDGAIRYVWVEPGDRVTDASGKLLKLSGIVQDITERVQAEKAIKQSEEKFSKAFRACPEAIAIASMADGRYVEVNEAFLNRTGYRRDEVINHTSVEIGIWVEPEDRQRFIAELSRNGYLKNFEARYRMRAGDIRVFWVSSEVIELEGEPCSLNFILDMTERNQAEDALRDSQARLAGMIDSAMDAVVSLDVDQRIILFNPAAEELFRCPAAAAIGQPLDQFIPDRFREAHREHIRLFGETGQTRRSLGTLDLLICLRSDGEEFPCEISISQAEMAGQKIYTAILRDVTERRLAEETMRLQSAALEAAANAIVITDRSGIIQWANPAFTTLTGYTTAEAIGHNPRDLIRSGKQDQAFYKNLWDTVLGGQVWRGELINRRKDGTLYAEEMTLTPLQDERGEVIRFIAIKQDVGERKRRERELEAIASMATALRAAPTRATMLPVIVHQVFGLLAASGAALATPIPESDEIVIAYGQGYWADWTGLRFSSGAGITGQVMATSRPFVTDHNLDDPRITRRDLIGDLPAIACLPLITQDASIGALWVGRTTAFTEADVRLVAAISDIAANALQRAQVVETLEQRVAERTRELAQANERLEELDRLKSKFVSDVSHELRTPVAILKLHTGLLEHGKPEKRDHYLKVIREQADRQAQLVDDILNLSRLELSADKVHFTLVALNPLIEQIVAAHQSSADAAGVALTFVPDPGLPPVWGEYNQLAQVVTNLITNALNYTPAGQVQVRTRQNDQQTCVEVRDTGMGIDAEDLPHVFDRFYRGKHASIVRGTGLGLAIVKEIVDLHGGRIDVESAKGSGAAFQIWLPSAGQPGMGQSQAVDEP